MVQPSSEGTGIAEVIVGKNRHGSLTTVKLAYQPSYVSFQNLFLNQRVNFMLTHVIHFFT